MLWHKRLDTISGRVENLPSNNANAFRGKHWNFFHNRNCWRSVTIAISWKKFLSPFFRDCSTLREKEYKFSFRCRYSPQEQSEVRCGNTYKFFRLHKHGEANPLEWIYFLAILIRFLWNKISIMTYSFFRIQAPHYHKSLWLISNDFSHSNLLPSFYCSACRKV